MIGSLRAGAARRAGAALTASGLLLAGGVTFAASASAQSNQGVAAAPDCKAASTARWVFAWDGAGTFTVSLPAGSKVPCEATTWQVSSYSLNPKWDGNTNLRLNDPARPSYPQHEFDNTTLTFPALSTGPVSATVAVPTCFGFQADIYTGDRVVDILTKNGHGRDYKEGGLVKLDECRPGVAVEKKLVEPAGPVHPGDTLEYDVTVSNTGETALYNVAVTDDLEAGVTFVPSDSDSRWAGAPNLKTVIPVLAVEASETLHVVVTVNQTGADEELCGQGATVNNVAAVEAVYPSPSPSATASPSRYTGSATASPAAVTYPDCPTPSPTPSTTPTPTPTPTPTTPTPTPSPTPSPTPTPTPTTPTPTPTFPTEVLGEKETAPPASTPPATPATQVLGEKLPYTGAPVGAALILSLILMAGGGALLLVSSPRRSAKHRA